MRRPPLSSRPDPQARPVGRVARRLGLSGSRSLSFLLALVLAAGRVDGDSTPSVPLDHWGYGFVERGEALGLIRGAGDGIKPLSRMEFAGLLQQLQQAPGAALSATDRERLERLRREFADELVALGAARPATATARLGGERPLYGYRTADGQVLLDLLWRQQTDRFAGLGRSQAEVIYRNRLGGVVRGDVHGVGYRLAFEQTREQGTRTYVHREDVFDPRVETPQLKGGMADYHRGTGYVVFGLPFADVQVGRDEVAWGPGPADNLGLSRNAPALDMVRLRTRLGALKLVSLHATLRPCPDRNDSSACGGQASPETYVVNHTTRWLDREKYLAAHRLEAAVRPWLDLGFQEQVIYGDRGPELAYLNPIMFYWAAQSYLGDKDNVLMGVDADFHPGHGLRAWAAYVVDDLKKMRVFSSDFTNKFSLQAGFLWVYPFGWQDTDIRAEYVRIEPWIYTHRYPINTYAHFGAPLGHALGPNSDRWQVQVSHRLTPSLALLVTGDRTRHGFNELLPDGTVRNVGGDLFLGWRPGDRRDGKTFLDGIRAQWTRWQLNGQWQPRTGVTMTAGVTVETDRNVPLPPDWDLDVPLTRRTGFGGGHSTQVSLDLQYGVF